MTTGAAVDVNLGAIKATLIERYDYNLDAVLLKHCVSIIPLTSGTRFLPNDFHKITTVKGGFGCQQLGAAKVSAHRCYPHAATRPMAAIP